MSMVSGGQGCSWHVAAPSGESSCVARILLTVMQELATEMTVRCVCGWRLGLVGLCVPVGGWMESYVRSSYTVASWPGLESSMTVMEKSTCCAGRECTSQFTFPSDESHGPTFQTNNSVPQHGRTQTHLREPRRERLVEVDEDSEPAVAQPADVVEGQEPEQAEDGGEDAYFVFGMYRSVLVNTRITNNKRGVGDAVVCVCGGKSTHAHVPPRTGAVVDGAPVLVDEAL